MKGLSRIFSIKIKIDYPRLCEKYVAEIRLQDAQSSGEGVTWYCENFTSLSSENRQISNSRAEEQENQKKRLPASLQVFWLHVTEKVKRNSFR